MTGSHQFTASKLDSTSAKQMVENAIQQQLAGDLDSAEETYRTFLNMHPDHPGVTHLLGVIQLQRGDCDEAIRLIDKAIDAAPGNAEYYSNRGAAYFTKGDAATAEENFRRAVELDPNHAESCSNLATLLKDKGELSRALELYKTAHRVLPQAGKYVKRIADMVLESSDFNEATEWFQKLVELEPDNAEAHNNLGYCYERLDDDKNAAVHYRRAVEMIPDAPELNNNLGSVLRRLGEIDEADVFFKRALEAPADAWQHASNLAGTLVNIGDFEKALEMYEKIIESGNADDSVMADYGIALGAAGRFGSATDLYLQRLAENPEQPEVWNNLGNFYFQTGELMKAEEALKNALKYRPRYVDAHLNLCLCLMYLSRVDEAYMYAKATTLLPEFKPRQFPNVHKVFRGVCDFDAIDEIGDILSKTEELSSSEVSTCFLELLPLCLTSEDIQRLADLHFQWGEDKGGRRPEEPLPAPMPRKGREKLHIGFCSSDLRSHSVAKFVLPILRNYDRDRFEISCFAPYESPHDLVQEEIKSMVSDFVVLQDMSDRDKAQAIRDRGVDVLFELNGYTKDTLINVLQFRPAPVQVYWLGYPFTTGMPEMDYIMLDPYYRPDNPDWLVEDQLQMPEAWVCFDSFEDVDIEEGLPFERDGRFTFGTLNNPYKFTRENITVWSEVMRQVPDSRFLLVRPEADTVPLQHNLRQEFSRNGIDPERVEFFNNRRGGYSHLHFYNYIDISLDTFPLTGGTTTCDAMWMGVPVISIVGPALHQRISYSLLENAGCGELACESVTEFVEKAVALANDHTSLREYRYGMRPALLKSPLCDGERFTRNFEGLMDQVATKHEL